MDDKAYLDSISKQVRPEKKSTGGLLSSPIAKVAIIGMIAMIVIMIFGSMFNGSSEGIKEESVALKFHIDNTLEAISEYQNNVKSSKLRSSSASLASVLSNTSRDLTNFLTDKYDYKESSKAFSKQKDAAGLRKDALLASLFNAKISGTLDRIYAHEMAYEIELIMAEETAVYNEISDETLRNSLLSSYNSLNNLHPDFDDFSESK